MTATFLSTQLTSLIQESKRKHVELRNATEKSLGDLKALPDTSETQLAGDLRRRPHFIWPLLIACGSRNGRFIGIAVLCFQRLIVARALAPERVREVVDALFDAASQHADVQLKILQALSPLVQNYPGELKGESMAKTLGICAELQSSKTLVVHSTATATLQQLVVAAFDQVAAEDESSPEGSVEGKVSIAGRELMLRPAALDAYRTFEDICIITSGQRPSFLRMKPIPPTTGLELIEAVLAGHPVVFSSHPEQIDVLRRHALPLVAKILSDRSDFPSTARAMRVFVVILRHQLKHLATPCEEILHLLTRLLDPDPAAGWRRALSMEVWRGIYSDFALLRSLYARFDDRDRKRDLIRDNFAKLARLAAERPDAIGLGNHLGVAPDPGGAAAEQSTEQLAIEAAGIGGLVGGAMGTRGFEPQGISLHASSVRTPCIDQLDKTEPPVLPESYIYSLVLLCIGDFADGLAKYTLPLTLTLQRRTLKEATRSMTSDGETILPLQEASSAPLATDGSSSGDQSAAVVHPRHGDVQSAVSMIEGCWPAALAACSTFLYAALDHSFFRGLVRSFQKLTHVSGLVGLKTPRDAFLTTLSKAAVPPYLTSPRPVTPPTAGPRGSPSSKDTQSPYPSQRNPKPLRSSSTDELREPPLPPNMPQLSVRNLLCLRALLNLGIALGPTLDGAWSIILETWQQADFLIHMSVRSNTRYSTNNARASESQSAVLGAGPSPEMQTEIAAVEAAGMRLLESTVETPDETFIDVLRALSRLMDSMEGCSSDESRAEWLAPKAGLPLSPSLSEVGRRSHRALNEHNPTTLPAHAAQFCLRGFEVTGRTNMARLVTTEITKSGWTTLADHLVSWTRFSGSSTVRLKAAEVLFALVREAVISSLRSDSQTSVENQLSFLSPLQEAIAGPRENTSTSLIMTSKNDLEIHRMALQTLEETLEACGESLHVGWSLIFDVLKKTFQEPKAGGYRETPAHQRRSTAAQEALSKIKLQTLMRPAFGSVQLICSDFMSPLSDRCLLALIDLLFEFCNQTEDLNTSLTSISLFWNVSSDLQSRWSMESLSDPELPSQTEDGLRTVAVSENGDSKKALWLVLLLRLMALALDQRADIRNGAIQSVFRVFYEYGDRLDVITWDACLRLVIANVLDRDVEHYHQLRATMNGSKPNLVEAWDETTIILLKSVAGLFPNYSGLLSQYHLLESLWAIVVRYMERVLEQDHPVFTVSVYRSLQQMLLTVKSAEELDSPLLESIWTLWLSDTPQGMNGNAKPSVEEEDILLAYVQVFEEMCRLTRHDLTSQRTIQIMEILYRCVIRLGFSAQLNDKDSITPLQGEILRGIKMLPTDVPGVYSPLVLWLAKLVTLPIDRRPAKAGARSTTYVGLAKSSGEYMQSLILDRLKDDTLYTSGTFSRALGSFVRCISRRSTVKGNFDRQSLRNTVVGFSLTILAAALPAIKELDLEKQHVQDIWNRVVAVVRALLSASDDLENIPQDHHGQEEHDVNAFLQLRTLISPEIGNAVVLDDTRRSYCERLFNTSIIHKAQAVEVPDSYETILEGLYDIRMGRTYDPPPSRFSRMSYVCLDELFALTRTHDGSPERIRLAQATAPFLILRVALPLRAFIADQPLRGLMPQPWSQRRELLDVLRKLISLECEPRAIPEAPGVVSEHRKHLHRIFPFVSKAIKAARSDQALLNELCRITDIVSEEMGIVS